MRRRLNWGFAAVVCVPLLLGIGVSAQAQFDGERTISLVSADSQRVAIGRVLFTSDGSRTRYTIRFDDERFENHFLSMRPFKCLTIPKGLMCRLPYPYEIAREITDGDLVDLEYDLLFIRKDSSEYGINPWNGMYYRLRVEGGGIVGRLHETDLNVLVTPPEGGNRRPILEAELYEADRSRHRYPTLEIR